MGCKPFLWGSKDNSYSGVQASPRGSGRSGERQRSSELRLGGKGNGKAFDSFVCLFLIIFPHLVFGLVTPFWSLSFSTGN